MLYALILSGDVQQQWLHQNAMWLQNSWQRHIELTAAGRVVASSVSRI